MKGKVTNMGMKASNKIATFFKYFVLILVGIIMIYPLLWMISATFKDNSEIFAGISLWIKKPTLDGYRNALNNFGGSINILQAMLNTYSYVIPKVICTVVSACIAAYGFGRFDFPGRKLLFNIMLATLFLPQVVLNVPQYALYFFSCFTVFRQPLFEGFPPFYYGFEVACPSCHEGLQGCDIV